ncbi:MAG: response regulator transcription factor [Desulfobacterales bacterium]|jgi:DNA-binding response OmpR family regulator
MDSHTAQRPVLVVEDDANTASLVATYLKREGFDPLVARDGETALEMARRHRPILVILDIMLPRLDGWEVCRRLQRRSGVPVLMLTARGEEIDRVAGLSLGADDYVVKPFSPRELVERVKAILRRARPSASVENRRLAWGGLVVDTEKLRVTENGRPISLTSTEFKLLKALMESPGRVFSRDQLLQHLYAEGETVVDRVIDVHIGKIRQKIEAQPSTPRYILTVRGFGYRFADEESP